MSLQIQRGQVYRADLGYGSKPWLVVSNNGRNRVLSEIVAVKIMTTTAQRPSSATHTRGKGTARELPTWVPLAPSDPLVGHVNTDCIEQIHKDELQDLRGALTRRTMAQVDQALRLALAL